MDILDNIVSIIETIFVLLLLGSIVWGAKSAFKIKGFVISISSIILIIAALIWYEKFLNYSINNNPALILIMLVIFAILLISLTLHALIEQAKAQGNDKIKFMKEQFKIALKQVAIGLLISFTILGIILLLVFGTNS